MKYINSLLIVVALVLLGANTAVSFVGALAYLFALDHMQEGQKDLFNYVVLGSCLIVLLPLTVMKVFLNV